MKYKSGGLVEMENRGPRDMILCFSGGIDSLAAWHYLGKPKSIFFYCTNYSPVELISAKYLNCNLTVNRTLSLAQYQEKGEAYILNRNLLFACIASNYGSTVVIAGLKDDMVEDKNPQAFKAMSKTLSLTSKKPINVISPFWEMTKSDVIRWFLDNVPNAKYLLGISVSCYEGVISCGMCPSCFRKACALWDNGIKTLFKSDPLMQYYHDRALQWKYDRERCQSIIKFVKEHAEWRKDSGHIC